MLMSMVNAKVFAYDVEIDGIYYNFYKSGEAWVVYKSTERVGGYYGYWKYINDYTGDVVIPESVTYEGVAYKVTTICTHAFEWSTNLTSVTIPNSVTAIGMHAFLYCTALSSITIPNSVTHIGESAFLGCDNLKTIVSLIEEPQMVSFENLDPFDEDNYNNTILYVPKGTIEKYMYARFWKNFRQIEENPNETGIQSLLFDNDIREIHSLNGEKIISPSKGINIIKMKDGTVKKILIK